MFKSLLIITLLISAAQADFWSKLVNVKVVKDNPQDMREYGYQVGYGDAQNEADPRYVYVNDKSDAAYNQGYREGYISGIVESGGIVVIEKPRRHHNDRVIIYKDDYDPNRIELIR